jgi:hypothetical protein
MGTITADPITITSAMSIYKVDTSPAALGYVYEEVSDNGIQIDPILFTGEGVGKNILQRKNAKYLYYEIDTGGVDATVTFYVDGTAKSTTFTLNKSTRTRDRLNLPNFEGYRFSMRITCPDRRGTKPVIYQPWAIQYTPYGV